jgi:phosphatidyl-myo-inositol dimannoside synthase
MDVPKTLLVTNAFPPKVGGIQRTLRELARELPPDRITVLAPQYDGWREFDAAHPYEVIREPGEFLWPMPALARRVDQAVRITGAEVVLFGDAFPLAMLGPRLARRGTPYVILGHGFDYWLSITFGAHAAMRYMTSRASGVLVCSRFIARVVRTAVPDQVPVTVLTPGADPVRFHPDRPTEDIRRGLGIGDRPLVACVSRLVPRKGQDMLIRAMPRIRARVPDAALLIVGSGPSRRRLHELARRVPDGSVYFAGEVAEEDVPRYYAAGDVFAMPCRNRYAGLEVEGWGNVFLEAAACGRPVVVGDSGGAKEALVDGETGLLVDGSSPVEIADAVADLLGDPERAMLMGKRGRERVERDHTWEQVTRRLADWLRRAAAGA